MDQSLVDPRNTPFRLLPVRKHNLSGVWDPGSWRILDHSSNPCRLGLPSGYSPGKIHSLKIYEYWCIIEHIMDNRCVSPI